MKKFFIKINSYLFISAILISCSRSPSKTDSVKSLSYQNTDNQCSLQGETSEQERRLVHFGNHAFCVHIDEHVVWQRVVKVGLPAIMEPLTYDSVHDFIYATEMNRIF